MRPTRTSESALNSPSLSGAVISTADGQSIPVASADLVSPMVSWLEKSCRAH
jgi:hypothetical protein